MPRFTAFLNFVMSTAETVAAPKNEGQDPTVEPPMDEEDAESKVCLCDKVMFGHPDALERKLCS